MVQYGIFIARLVHLGPAKLSQRHRPHIRRVDTCRLVHIDSDGAINSDVPWSRFCYDAASVYSGTARRDTHQCLHLSHHGLLAALRKILGLTPQPSPLPLVGISTPTFILGVILQYIFAYRMGLLPLSGGGDTLADQARHAVLPALTLGLRRSDVHAGSSRRDARPPATGLCSDGARKSPRVAGGDSTRAAHALVPIVTVTGRSWRASEAPSSPSRGSRGRASRLRCGPSRP